MPLADHGSLILVTGATGALGPRVVEALLAEGYRVRTFSLDPAPTGFLPAEVEQKRGDISDAHALGESMRDVAGVVHLAALLHKMDPPPEWRSRYLQVNVEGTRQALRAARENGVRRFIFFSTIGVYGPCAGRVLDETSPTRPGTLYGESKLQAEQLVLCERDSAGHPTGVVLRLAAVYGSRIKGNYRRLVEALARGRFVPVGDGSNRRTLIYDCDAARAACLALSHPSAAGNVYNVTDGEVYSLSHIIEVICRGLSRRPPRFYVPARLARTLAGLVQDLMRMAGRHPFITRSAIDKFTEDMAVDGSRFQAELGFRPAWPLESGWEETIRLIQQDGLLT